MKKIIVSVTNDLSTDQRVDRVCNTLQRNGFDVLLVGRELKSSKPLNLRAYQTHRMKLWFEKGFLFYASFNISLFFFLLFAKADILLANDLDTLPANFFCSKIKSQTLVYDSHEYFTGVPEIQDRPFVKNIWKRIERFILPKIKFAYTVNESIAKLYKDEYNIDFGVVRNLPLKRNNVKSKTRKELGLPENKKLIVLQGSGINVDRGGEEAVQAMEFLDDSVLLIIGSGDVINILKTMSEKPGINGKVIFKGKLPYTEMLDYTTNADVGISFDKDTNINYRFSLPNKIFDYIQCGIPVLVSRLPEIEKVVTHYRVGDFIETHEPKHIAAKLNEMLSNTTKQSEWKANTVEAAKVLNWENEEKELMKTYNQILSPLGRVRVG
ncbi:MAG: D-inositol-3-phosphate glycosyltransferase [Bacteroidia bacterium]|nr:D-inositol-3-phosphate glycosyltransferase [Bacteroidia bacterium]